MMWMDVWQCMHGWSLMKPDDHHTAVCRTPSAGTENHTTTLCPRASADKITIRTCACGRRPSADNENTIVTLCQPLLKPTRAKHTHVKLLKPFTYVSFIRPQRSELCINHSNHCLHLNNQVICRLLKLHGCQRYVDEISMMAGSFLFYLLALELCATDGVLKQVGTISPCDLSKSHFSRLYFIGMQNCCCEKGGCYCYLESFDSSWDCKGSRYTKREYCGSILWRCGWI